MYILNTKLPSQYAVVYVHLLKEYVCYLEQHCGVNTKRNKSSYESALKCLLYNINISGHKINLSLDKNVFSKGEVVNGKRSRVKVSYIFTKRLIDFLTVYGYARLEKGGFDHYEYVYNKYNNEWVKEKVFKSSYLILTDSGINLFSDTVPEFIAERNVIFVKNKDKDVVTFNMTPYLKDKRNLMQEINLFNSKQEVKVKDRLVGTQGYKVFNNSSENNNGKIYIHGGYQNLSKEERMYTKINDKTCCGWDYSAFEPSIVYTLAGVDIGNSDLYYIGMNGFDPKFERSLIKQVLLIMLNSNSRVGALSSVSLWLKEYLDLDKLYKNKLIPSKTLSASKLVKAVEGKHTLIKHLLYGNDRALDISNLSAEIADFVVKWFVDRGKMCIPVFDCFVVQREDQENLKQVMFTAYERVLGDNRNCRIKQEF